MIHEVPDPQPLTEVRVTPLTPQLAAKAIQDMTMEEYIKVRQQLLGPAMVEWGNHFKNTGSLV